MVVRRLCSNPKSSLRALLPKKPIAVSSGTLFGRFRLEIRLKVGFDTLSVDGSDWLFQISDVPEMENFVFSSGS